MFSIRNKEETLLISDITDRLVLIDLLINKYIREKN